MSVTNLDVPLRLESDAYDEARTFTGIRELGFSAYRSFIIHAWTTPAVPEGEPRGSYTTSIPVSSLEYRRRYGHMKAGFRRVAPDEITVWSDYGCAYAFTAPPAVADALERECEEHELPRREA